MANECDGRARMAAAKLLCWFYGLKSPIEQIASYLYVHDNQWYLSSQNIYVKASRKDPSHCRWSKIESEDLCAWSSDDDCVFYTFVDPKGSLIYFGPGITKNDRGYNKLNGVGEIDLRCYFPYYNEDEKQYLTVGLIDIITKKTWKIEVPCPENIISCMDKWNRMESIRHQIEVKAGTY